MKDKISLAIAIIVVIAIASAAIMVSKFEENRERYYCDGESRNVEACIEIYEPVCGWFDESVNCVKYPCAETFGNSCFSCMNSDVAYYTKGECPV